MSRFLKETSQFKTDKKRVKKSGRYDWEKMRAIVKELMNDRPLDAKHRDHALTGEYAGAMECHIESDWLLIYDKDGTQSVPGLSNSSQMGPTAPKAARANILSVSSGNSSSSAACQVRGSLHVRSDVKEGRNTFL